ncbi:uncharacterized protein AB675_7008 [Cyphellophora attinorum]|uniref:Uncharacterized protein n=1 Tax=Cyphellophora attinorum TaxID=1664694 RepID=A0A0N0NPW5_9EURO|nr:uncharacterized protein AB675_7008 [Phialophora attinorum]KPI43231.1 hypothetical protein AB675_7008 [Phialophora attinorum]
MLVRASCISSLYINARCPRTCLRSRKLITAAAKRTYATDSEINEDGVGNAALFSRAQARSAGHPKGDPPSLDLLTRHIGMIYTRKADPISERSEVRRIVDLLPTFEWRSATTHLDTALLMITPRLASLLQEDMSSSQGTTQSFLESVMKRLFPRLWHMKLNEDGYPALNHSGETGGEECLTPEYLRWSQSHKSFSELNAIIGVVDKLPGPQQSSAVFAEGLEGMAYFIGSSRDMTWQERQDSARDAAQLKFRYSSGPLGLSSNGDFELNGIASLAVPMANTLFINGQSSTLRRITWSRSCDTGHRWAHSSATQLTTVDIAVRQSCQLFGDLCLAPLTKFRPITSALGNVISSIEVDGTSQPASRELEAAVDDVRQTTKLAGDATSLPFSNVYAMLRSAAWQTPRKTYKNVFDGQRIHRVTGGGGGWGDRAGILSLEPAVSFDTSGQTSTNAADTPFAAIDFDAPELPDITSALDGLRQRSNDIVQPDDMIAFYHDQAVRNVPNHPSLRMDRYPQQLRDAWHRNNNQQLVLLGTAVDPNYTYAEESSEERQRWTTGDNMSPPVKEFHDTTTEKLAHGELVLIKDRFGVLSERGVALDFIGIRKSTKRRKSKTNSDGSKAPQEADERDAGAGQATANSTSTSTERHGDGDANATIANEDIEPASNIQEGLEQADRLRETDELHTAVDNSDDSTSVRNKDVPNDETPVHIRTLLPVAQSYVVTYASQVDPDNPNRKPSSRKADLPKNWQRMLGMRDMPVGHAQRVLRKSGISKERMKAMIESGELAAALKREQLARAPDAVPESEQPSSEGERINAAAADPKQSQDRARQDQTISRGARLQALRERRERESRSPSSSPYDDEAVAVETPSQDSAAHVIERHHHTELRMDDSTAGSGSNVQTLKHLLGDLTLSDTYKRAALDEALAKGTATAGMVQEWAEARGQVEEQRELANGVRKMVDLISEFERIRKERRKLSRELEKREKAKNKMRIRIKYGNKAMREEEKALKEREKVKKERRDLGHDLAREMARSRKEKAKEKERARERGTWSELFKEM